MTPNAADRDARIDEAIAEFLESSPDPTAWLTKHAELRPELESFLVDRAAFVRAAEPVNPMTVGFDESPNGNGSLVGTVRYFGDYELLSEIARGGMGVVYKARQARLNRVVALKMIVKGALASPEDVRRFRTEAEAAALLDHPNIVPIYEVGEHEGQQYFAMKYVEGQTLTALRRSSPDRADIRSAVAVLSQVARAVQYAHQRGILHRDLKPGNVLLDRAGIPYVTDFGLAKRFEGDATLTQSGAVVGTPSYMAPEQARAERQLTTAADIWSLGAVLYELSAGRPPFRADGMMATLKLVLESEPPRPRLLNPLVDRDLETVILRCLEKEPAKRYGSAEALADDLERWLRGEPVQARRVTAWERGWKWAKRRPAVASLLAACVVLFLAGTVVSWLLTLDARRARDESKERARESRRMLNTLSLEQGWTAEQDGDIFRALLWYAEPLNDPDLDPAEEVIVRRRLGMYLRNVSAVQPRLEMMFSGGLESSAKVEPPKHVVDANSDGRLVACLIYVKEGATAYPAVEVLDVSTGRVIMPPARNPAVGQCVRFSPDGMHFATAGDDLIQLWDANRGQPVGSPVKCAQRVYDLTFSPDGGLLVPAIGELYANAKDIAKAEWDKRYQAGIDLPVFRVRDGLQQATVIRHGLASCVRHVVFSPDSRQLLTIGDGWWRDEQGRARGSAWTGWVWSLTSDGNIAGTHPIRIAAEVVASYGNFRHRHPSQAGYSPDGRRVVIAADENVAVWNIDRAGEPMIWLHHSANVQSASFSQDGKSIVTACDDRTVRIWEVETGRLARPAIRTNEPPSWATFAPDGRTVWTRHSLGSRFRAWDSATAKPMSPSLPTRRFYENMSGVSVRGDVVLAHSDYALDRLRIDVFDRRPREDLLLLVRLISGTTLREGRPEPLSEDDCRAGWERIRARYPHVFTVPVEECVRWRLGKEDAHGRDERMALFAANQEIADNPNQPDGYLFRARVNMIEGRWQDAAADFERAIQLGGTAWLPAEFAGTFESHWSTVMNTPQPADFVQHALAAAELAQRFAPADRHAQLLGAAQYRTGQFTSAVETLAKLVASQKLKDANTLAFLAMAHFRLGHVEPARALLTEMQALPADEGSQELRAEAAKLIGSTR